MKKKSNIRLLTERFFQGETTLEEEHELYRLYRRGDVPTELLHYRELFLDMQAAAVDEPLAQKIPLRKTLFYRWMAVAVVALLLIVNGAFFLSRRMQVQDECEAYIYGRRTTDPAVVMSELRCTAATMVTGNGQDNVEQQLNEMFNLE